MLAILDLYLQPGIQSSDLDRWGLAKTKRMASNRQKRSSFHCSTSMQSGHLVGHRSRSKSGDEAFWCEKGPDVR